MIHVGEIISRRFFKFITTIYNCNVVFVQFYQLAGCEVFHSFNLGYDAEIKKPFHAINESLYLKMYLGVDYMV